jgi:hypothetical protein
MTRARLSSSIGLALLVLIISGCSQQSPTAVTELPTAPGHAANASTVKPVKIAGHQDKTDCDWVFGWAWDKDHPDAVVQVDIYDGSALMATIAADKFRQDLLDGGVGTGKYGFTFRMPATVRDGKAHVIRIRVHGSDTDLEDTPKTITCPVDGRATRTSAKSP